MSLFESPGTSYEVATLVALVSALIALLVSFPTYRAARNAARQAAAAEQQNQIGLEALQAVCASRLLSECLAIQAQMEAWMLEGPRWREARLSDHKDLPTCQLGEALWLRPVEVRAVFDEGQWNSIGDQEYGFINGRRAWIVRDVVLRDHDYVGGSGPSESHPALLSSRPLEELAGWADEVRLSRSRNALTDEGLAFLRPFLVALAAEARLRVLRPWLTAETQTFLRKYAASPTKPA